jgi:hypothetical protein
VRPGLGLSKSCPAAGVPKAGGGVRAQRAHSTSSGRQASRSRKRACGERVAFARTGAHEAAFDGMRPGRCAATPPQACPRRERPFRRDMHEAGGDTLRAGSTVAGASEGGTAFPLGCDPGDAQGPADDAPWPAPPVPSLQVGASQVGRGFPLGSDPAGAQGPADDVHWPAPRSHPHTWRPWSALRRPLLRVVPAPCSTLHRPACVQRDSARTQLRPSDLAR